MVKILRAPNAQAIAHLATVQQSAEPADFGSGVGANHRLDQIDQTIAHIDVDARIRLSEPVLAVDPAQSR
jgi:hypothetical protein